MNLASRRECIDGQDPPRLAEGDTIELGVYYRNLRDADVARIYTDSEEAGHRINRAKARRWRDVELQRGLSVNLSICIKSLACSILVHEDAGQYHHIWELNLESLNAFFSTSQDKFLAVYRPTNDNKCHFELVSSEGVLNPVAIINVLEQLERNFPPVEKSMPKGKRVPQGQEEIAKSAQKEYAKVVIIHRNPLSSRGVNLHSD